MQAVRRGWRGRLRHSWLGLLSASITACGEWVGPTSEGAPHPVSGRVTVSGHPAAGVQVRLHLLNRSRDADAPRPEATTDKEGRYRLRTGGDRDGAPSGQFVVTLIWPGGGGADRLGGAYAEPDGSGLIAVIEETTTELPPFEINTKLPWTPPAQ